MKELKILATLENFTHVVEYIEENLLYSNCDVKLSTQMLIAVEEIYVNIAKYAYSADIGDVTIKISVDEDITIIFIDHGMLFDPSMIADPDISLPAKERKIGGLGIFMVKNIMDTFEYKREDGQNILTMKKKLEIS